MQRSGNRGLSVKLLASLPEALVTVDKLELSGEYKRPVKSSHWEGQEQGAFGGVHGRLPECIWQ